MVSKYIHAFELYRILYVYSNRIVKQTNQIKTMACVPPFSVALITPFHVKVIEPMESCINGFVITYKTCYM